MKNLKNLLTTPLQLVQIPKWLPVALIILALIGFSDATYLTVEHYQNKIPPCTISGCETVLTSPYAEVFGIPVSLMGMIYYLLISISLFAYFNSKNELFLRVPILLSVFGLIASLWFFFVQAFIIKAFCQYCILSGITSLFIFVISVYALVHARTRDFNN